MQTASSPIVKDLVLVGGGHSHCIALRMFGMKPLPGVRITLITETSHTPYSGMLPGHIAGFYDFDESHIDLRPLGQFAQAQLYIDRVIGLDLENNKVICANHPDVGFDILSIDIGSTPATISVLGAAEYAIPVKPVGKFLTQWEDLVGCVAQKPEKPITLGIVGGGAGGVELALAVDSRLRLTPPTPPCQGGDKGKASPLIGGDIGKVLPNQGEDIGKALPYQKGDIGKAFPNQEGDTGKASSYQEGDTGKASPNQEGDTGKASSYQEGDTGKDFPNQEGDTGKASSYQEGDTGKASSYQEGDTGKASSYQEGDTGKASSYQEGDTGKASLYQEGDTGKASPYQEGDTGKASPYQGGDKGKAPPWQGGVGGVKIHLFHSGA